MASGRFHAPAIPPVPGLDTFAGSAGAISTYHYRGPAPYQGKRVLVAGCAISALEIAAELAQSRRSTRCRYPAPTEVRPTEVRRRSAVRSPDLHAVRNPRERDSPSRRGRPAAEGDRRRGRRKSGAVRRTSTRPVDFRRRDHPQPAVPTARGRGTNYGVPLDEIHRGCDRDVRRRRMPRSSTGLCSALGSICACRF